MEPADGGRTPDPILAKKTPPQEIVLIESMDLDRYPRAFAGSRRRALALAVAALLLAGCAKKKTIRVPVAPVAGSVEVGIGSWYGYPYHGRRSANGEIYDMEKLTAAHRTLPFDCWVEVTNLSNNKKVKVRITDRGPFVEGRIIDLSRAAARQIDMLGPGIVKVRLEVIDAPRRPPAGELYAVQVGAFQNRSNAERLEKSLRKRYPHCRLVRRESSSPAWRVLVGEEPTEEAADALARELRGEFGAAFVVRLDEPAADGL
jgi:rare lipoprotein A